MKTIFFYMLCMIGLSMYGQQEFHVFPKENAQTPGNETGDGSLNKPWDLQTALSQKPEIVKSGDTIWLHEGIYNGRFISKLQSLEPNKYITVSAFQNDHVVLNGNVPSQQSTVLEVKGKQVAFKNFEVTWLGDYSRDKNDPDFELCSGIKHHSGENCWFYNIKIHNNPGLGMGSWKHGAGTVIENCMIYSNGFVAKDGSGRGEGIYVQNKSDEVRLIKNNIIYNNYYKGVEVWSAKKKSDIQFVKNITLEGNVIFHSGSPAGKLRDNVIVASADRNGINVAHNISVINNVLFHNIGFKDVNAVPDSPSMTLGFNKNAPIQDVTVNGNIIAGGYNALRLLQIRSLEFKNNSVYSGNIEISPSISNYFQDWNFNSNTFYSRLSRPFRVTRVKDYSIKTWQKAFGLDKDSERLGVSSIKLDAVLHMSSYSEDENKFNLALFDSEGKDVTVDFSAKGLNVGEMYTIYDAENPNEALISGTVSDDFKITFPMQSSAFERPRHNTKAIKTHANFGVFIIEFDSLRNQEVMTEEQKSWFGRLFKWLGF